MIRLVQCWDDGVEDDLRLIELLRRHGARATFNLNAGLHGAQRGGTWRYQDCKDVRRLARPELAAVYAGFTIANHSLTHPWPTRIPLADWQHEVVEGRKQLQDLFGQPVWGFAYPYGDVNEAVIEVVRAAGHRYARAPGRVHATVGYPPAERLLFATNCHFAAPDFWERYAAAQAAHASVFYFWGHSYEMVTDADWQAFADKLASLTADPTAVWADLPDLFPAAG